MYLEIFTLIFGAVCCGIFYMVGRRQGKAYYSAYYLCVDYKTGDATWVNQETGKKVDIDNPVHIIHRPHVEKVEKPDVTETPVTPLTSMHSIEGALLSLAMKGKKDGEGE